LIFKHFCFLFFSKPIVFDFLKGFWVFLFFVLNPKHHFIEAIQKRGAFFSKNV